MSYDDLHEMVYFKVGGFAEMQNENMLIDRFAKRLKESYPQADRNNPCPAIYYDDFCNIVDEIAAEMNSIDTVEMVCGKWIRKPIGKYTGADEVCCSICNYFIGVVSSDTGFKEAIKDMNYCNSCGAKMDE